MQSAVTQPWYKHLWPWIIIGMMAVSVTLSLVMVRIAIDNQDSLVSDNYYEAGKGINRSLNREHLALRLRLQAEFRIDESTGDVELKLSGDSTPEKLTLNLISPTLESQDRHVELHRDVSRAGYYIGHLDATTQGRRFVELLGSENDQTWRLFEEETILPHQEIVLGDEPLKGAEVERP